MAITIDAEFRVTTNVEYLITVSAKPRFRYEDYQNFKINSSKK
jgi:hypothetical protein